MDSVFNPSYFDDLYKLTTNSYISHKSGFNTKCNNVYITTCKTSN